MTKSRKKNFLLNWGYWSWRQFLLANIVFYLWFYDKKRFKLQFWKHNSQANSYYLNIFKSDSKMNILQISCIIYLISVGYNLK